MIVPPGYERLLQAHAVAVARSDVIPALRQALVAADGTRSTLYDFAARAPGARALQGRGTSYAVRLPHGAAVVVRHNRHGGMLASLTGDRFLAPTRAPLELEIALALTARGVPTPEVLAYVLYPPGGVFQRADVATAEVPSSRDLAETLAGDGGGTARALDATADLVASLSLAGARHHDLNAKNVLLASGRAFVLDVDRVTLGHPLAEALEGNLSRLARSLRKWRGRHAVAISETDIARLEARAREVASGG